MRKSLAISGLSLLLAASTAWAQPAQPAPGVAPGAVPGAGDHEIGLTIYSSADPAGFDPQQFIGQQRQGIDPQFASQVPGFGVIRDVRELDLKKGLNTIGFTDVAQFIDPTTVSLSDLSVPLDQQEKLGVRVSQQKFVFDLVSPGKLLDKYIDRPITIFVNIGEGKRDTVTGTLLSNNGGSLVIQTADGIRVISGSNDVQLGALPGGLVTRPTLQWELWAPDAGKRRVRTAYQTSGITWRSDYNLILNADDTKADLGAWVTILNLSGAAYPNASLKLIAGDVQRIQRQQAYPMLMAAGAARAENGAAGFEEKSFFEYHMYTLPDKVTIDANATQQLVLFPTVHGIKVEKILVYFGAPQFGYWAEPNLNRDLGGNTGNKKLDVYIRFDNKQDNMLGIPLPKGKVRVYKVDEEMVADTKQNPGGGTLEFVGEDLIDHTPKNQQVLIKVGQSFDVTGSRTQTEFNVNQKDHVLTETYKITLKNAKKDAQKVVIRETLNRWKDWEITKKSEDYEKIDSHTIHFNVDVPAEGEKTVTYTVKYTW